MATTEQFGTSAIGTPLFWNVHEPNQAQWPFPWNVVINAHGGGWATGFKEWETATSASLAAAGIACCTIDYELSGADGAPLLPGQSEPVVWPNQAPDYVLAVLAARNPASTSVLFGKVTGKVGAQGGSAGATLAMDACLMGTVDEDRADCCVALSANYDFSDQDSLDKYETQGPWITQVMTYNSVPDRTHLEQLYNQSVLPLVLEQGAANIPPLFMVQSSEDNIGPPTSQMAQMVAALQSVGFSNYTTAMPIGDLHAKDNWNATNPATGNPVRVDAINFFKASFAAGTGGQALTKGFRLSLIGGPYTLPDAVNENEYPPEIRSAVITGLTESTVMQASLVAFNEHGEGVPATYQFTTPAGGKKQRACGIYHLLQSAGGVWWDDVPGKASLGYDWIIGYRARGGINTVQPDSPVGFEWDDYDTTIDTYFIPNNKKFGLSISNGITTPDWWYDIGGPDEVARCAIDLADITPQAYQPIFWDPKHLEKMQTWITALGAKWDAHPNLSYMVMCGFMQLNGGYVSKTVADDLQWDGFATDFGYDNKNEAYMAAAVSIIQMWQTAFPNTPLIFTANKPWVGADGPVALGEIVDFIRNETGGHCGHMFPAVRSQEGPWDAPTSVPYPKGGQAISGSTNPLIYFPEAPDPYPDPPQLMVDFVNNNYDGNQYLEVYTVDANNPVNQTIFEEANVQLCLNRG